jgi:DNA-binding transcriptional LysR family regulator
MISMNGIERLSERIDSDLLHTFIAVAEAGSVTAAGQRLGRTQSAVSVQIGKLEDRLGVRLFERAARGMHLTPEGDRLLTAARPLLLQLNRLPGLFGDPLTGAVRVGLPDDYGDTVLEHVLAEFAARHPAVDVFVRCGFSVDFPDALARGDLDLAAHASDRVAEPDAVLIDEPTVWVAHERWAGSPGEPIPLAVFDRACWWRHAALQALDRSGIAHRIAFSSQSFSGVRAAVTAGLAVGMLAHSTVRSPMRILDAAEGMPTLPRSALTLMERPGPPTPAMAAMADAIRAGFRTRERGID